MKSLTGLEPQVNVREGQALHSSYSPRPPLPPPPPGAQQLLSGSVGRAARDDYKTTCSLGKPMVHPGRGPCSSQ